VNILAQIPAEEFHNFPPTSHINAVQQMGVCPVLAKIFIVRSWEIFKFLNIWPTNRVS
jgi:hypothetical protein